MSTDTANTVRERRAHPTKDRGGHAWLCILFYRLVRCLETWLWCLVRNAAKHAAFSKSRELEALDLPHLLELDIQHSSTSADRGRCSSCICLSSSELMRIEFDTSSQWASCLITSQKGVEKVSAVA